MAHKVVYAYVVGDLFHIGHLKMLQQARALGDYLIVGVLTDRAVWEYKRAPIIPFTERIQIFESLKCVNEVVPQLHVDPTDNLKAMPLVDVVVHGDDWDENFLGAEYMRSIGKEAIRTRYYEDQSTTKIINKIKEGNV